MVKSSAGKTEQEGRALGGPAGRCAINGLFAGGRGKRGQSQRCCCCSGLALSCSNTLLEKERFGKWKRASELSGRERKAAEKLKALPKSASGLVSSAKGG